MKSVQNNKSTDEDDFELVVEEDDLNDRESESSKNEFSENENFVNDNNSDKLKTKPVTKKSKPISQTKLPGSSKPKAEILSNRPKLPSCKALKLLVLIIY